MSSRTRLSHPRSQAGFTIIEVMVAAMLLLVGMLGVVAMVDRAAESTTQTKMREGATNLAREIAEQARAVPFTQITQDALTARLQALPGLAGESAAPWVIERRGVRYTVTATVCAIDDQRDGLGDKAAGGFCPGQSPGTADVTPNDFKRVLIRASWRDRTTTRQAEIATLISTNGAADAPAVRSLEATSAFQTGTAIEPVITSTSTTTVTFQAETTSSATNIIWSVDGIPRTPQATTAGPNLWTFTLDLAAAPPLTDGIYEIGARAVDANGIEGAQFSIPLRLIRGPAAAPTGLTYGANEVRKPGETVAVDAVELDWLENAAKNVIGYRVYRDAETTPICPDTMDALVTRPGCVDLAPTFGTYSVAALYLDRDNVVQESARNTIGPIQRPGGRPLHLYDSVAALNANCATTGTRDMSLTAPAQAVTGFLANNSTWRFCSRATDTFPLKSADVVAKVTVQNEHTAQECNVETAVGINGTMGALSAVQSAPKRATTQLSFPHTLTRSTLNAGDRLHLAVKFTNAGCNEARLRLGYLGTGSTSLNVPIGIERPAPPVSPTRVASDAGGVELRWSAPASSYPAVAFYRIYRDATDYKSRIDRTGDATTLKAVDNQRAFGSSTRYWVTAVSANLAESDPVEVP